MRPAKRQLSALENMELEKGVDRFGKPVVACGLCGAPTNSIATKRCDPCWELERLVHDRPAVAFEVMKEGGFL